MVILYEETEDSNSHLSSNTCHAVRRYVLVRGS